MKINLDRLYTHPVLADERDDYKTCKFSVERNLLYDTAGSIILEMNCSTNCTEIQQLVRSGKAQYLLHVECPTTLYRRIEKSNLEKFSVTIKLDDVKNKIYCVAFIVLNEAVEDFSCADWHDDFAGITFNLAKGTVLAYENLLPLVIYESDIFKTDKVSIFTISKRVDDASMPFEVNPFGEKIDISLNEADYNLYREYYSIRELQTILNTAVILPALVYIFEELKRDSERDFEKYGDYKWFSALEKTFDKQKINFREYVDSERTSIEMAQKVMGLPLAKVLKNIDLIYEDAARAEGDDD